MQVCTFCHLLKVYFLVTLSVPLNCYTCVLFCQINTVPSAILSSIPHETYPNTQQGVQQQPLLFHVGKFHIGSGKHEKYELLPRISSTVPNAPLFRLLIDYHCSCYNENKLQVTKVYR